MKILVDEFHIPYSYDLLRALAPSGELYHCHWNVALRPRVDGAKIIGKDESLGVRWDLLITDGADELFSVKTNTGHRILVKHLERMEPVTERLIRNLSRYDAIVTPAANKTATWMDLPYRLRFVTIPIAVSGEDYPPVEDYSSTIVGTALNGMQLRMGCVENWTLLTAGCRDTFVIGGSNDPNLIPASRFQDISNWANYKTALRSLGVFIYCVEGNETGMTPREAMASGIPVVTGVMPELYWFGYPGWDICMSRGACSQTIPQLRQWISRLQTDRVYRELVGRNGRRAILRAYPMEAFRLAWRKLVAEVTA